MKVPLWLCVVGISLMTIMIFRHVKLVELLPSGKILVRLARHMGVLFSKMYCKLSRDSKQKAANLFRAIWSCIFFYDKIKPVKAIVEAIGEAIGWVIDKLKEVSKKGKVKYFLRYGFAP